MLTMPDTKPRFFSVAHGTKIQGVSYIPSVCYPLPASLQAAVEAMAAEGTARVYTEKVRFVTGVPYPVKKPATGAAGVRADTSGAKEAKTGTGPSPVQKPLGTVGKLGRRSGRGAYPSQTAREFD
jgi:hypothetical protein